MGTNKINKLVIICILVCLLSKFVQPAPFDQTDSSCRHNNSHKKFDKCTCDEYAKIMNKDEADVYSQEGVIVHRRMDIPLHSKRSAYYICSPCTRCGDGIFVEHMCTRKSDTVCSATKCTDETLRFDFGMKACRPRPTESPTIPPTFGKTAPREETVPDKPPKIAGLSAEGSQGDGSIGTALWLKNNHHAIIIGLVVGFVLLICILVFVAIKGCRAKRNCLLDSRTPSSSQSSSNASIHDV